MKNNKNFDCVKMTREIRDKLYEENKGKNSREYLRTLSQEAHKSPLWKGLNVVEKTR
jgi:hypothetical protein